MSIRRLILATISLLGGLYTGISLVYAIILFNGTLLLGILGELLISKGENFSKPNWEATITLNDEVIIFQDKRKNLLFFYQIRQVQRKSDLLKLQKLSRYNFQFMESNGLFCLVVSIKSPKTRDISELKEFCKQKSQEFVEIVKILAPGLNLTPVISSSLLPLIFGFHSSRDTIARDKRSSRILTKQPPVLEPDLNENIDIFVNDDMFLSNILHEKKQDSKNAIGTKFSNDKVSEEIILYWYIDKLFETPPEAPTFFDETG